MEFLINYQPSDNLKIDNSYIIAKDILSWLDDDLYPQDVFINIINILIPEHKNYFQADNRIDYLLDIFKNLSKEQWLTIELLLFGKHIIEVSKINFIAFLLSQTSLEAIIDCFLHYIELSGYQIDIMSKTSYPRSNLFERAVLVYMKYEPILNDVVFNANFHKLIELIKLLS